ncbi:unnamed protein product [Vitrella brassicaformis CCMP3155]|uniref:DDE-1 domain-containing protein n=1 Tax=Vitrella brassicaformis (strain CCMP3155) TaxID=1169540 RepID=A0A0G4FL99_VITBC|nr:unnamed protein product [Vitrella brassicaformis CCMP3155]|eukprot:CEM14767.1 unnamed protein product [Vitrella brassicaformis CCMP3155]
MKRHKYEDRKPEILNHPRTRKPSQKKRDNEEALQEDAAVAVNLADGNETAAPKAAAAGKAKARPKPKPKSKAKAKAKPKARGVKRPRDEDAGEGGEGEGDEGHEGEGEDADEGEGDAAGGAADGAADGVAAMEQYVSDAIAAERTEMAAQALEDQKKQEANDERERKKEERKKLRLEQKQEQDAAAAAYAETLPRLGPLPDSALMPGVRKPMAAKQTAAAFPSEQHQPKNKQMNDAQRLRVIKMYDGTHDLSGTHTMKDGRVCPLADQDGTPRKLSNRLIADIAGFTKWTIQRVTQHWEWWRATITVSADPARKRYRKQQRGPLEKALRAWFADNHVTGLVKDTFPGCAFPTDQAPVSWVKRFVRNHRLVCRRLEGEAAEADRTATYVFQRHVLYPTLLRFRPEDIYNMDGSALYLGGMPTRAYMPEDTHLAGRKKHRKRVSIVAYVNMTGTDKRRLLVIYKSKNPRDIAGWDWEKHVGHNIDRATTPSTYITSERFEQWAADFNDDMREQGRHALLILDNHSTHFLTERLSNVTMLYLPPKATALIQPLDAGIIWTLKVKYMARELQWVWGQLAGRTDSQAGKGGGLRRCLEIPSEAWAEVTPVTIENCLRHARCTVESLKELFIRVEGRMPEPQQHQQTDGIDVDMAQPHHHPDPHPHHHDVPEPPPPSQQNDAPPPHDQAGHMAHSTPADTASAAVGQQHDPFFHPPPRPLPLLQLMAGYGDDDGMEGDGNGEGGQPSQLPEPTAPAAMPTGIPPPPEDDYMMMDDEEALAPNWRELELARHPKVIAMGGLEAYMAAWRAAEEADNEEGGMMDNGDGMMDGMPAGDSDAVGGMMDNGRGMMDGMPAGDSDAVSRHADAAVEAATQAWMGEGVAGTVAASMGDGGRGSMEEMMVEHTDGHEYLVGDVSLGGRYDWAAFEGQLEPDTLVVPTGVTYKDIADHIAEERLEAARQSMSEEDAIAFGERDARPDEQPAEFEDEEMGEAGGDNDMAARGRQDKRKTAHILDWWLLRSEASSLTPLQDWSVHFRGRPSMLRRPRGG